MRIIIAGSRSATQNQVFAAIAHANLHSWGLDEVVSGACPAGADYYGEKYADLKRIPVTRFPADWDAYGQAAGPKRNRQMAKYADGLLAIWDGKSKGTKNMIEEATKRGLKVYVYRLDALPARPRAPEPVSGEGSNPIQSEG